MKITKKLLIWASGFLFIFISLIFVGVYLITGDVSFAKDPGMIQQNIVVNGEQRLFYIHLPIDYNKDKKFPVVLVFHGTVANANKIKNYTKFNDFAEKNGIIAVYPENTDNWDWDLRSPDKSKEVKYVNDLIDFMIKTYNVDKKRIYQTGYSSGAEMSYILACALPDKIAAFVPVAGNIRESYIKGCLTNKPVSIMLIHGTNDPYEKWNGDHKKRMLAVDDTLNFWKKRDSCTGIQTEKTYPQTVQSNSTIVKLFINNSCKNGSEVSILKIEGGGHTWPGAPTSSRIETFLGKTSYDVNANEIIWEFFQRHELD